VLSYTAPAGLVSFVDQTNGNFSLGSAALDPSTRTAGWQSFSTFASAAGNYAVVIGDLDGDGVPDIVIGNYAAGTVSVALGNGDGTFRTNIDTAVTEDTLFGMTLCDFNGDGIPDLAVASHNSSFVYVLLGNRRLWPRGRGCGTMWWRWGI
jgi:hypothetical protein